MLCSVPAWTTPVLTASSCTSAQVTLAAAFCKLQAHALKVRMPKQGLSDRSAPSNASGLVNGTTSHLAARFIVSRIFKTTFSIISTFCGHHISAVVCLPWSLLGSPFSPLFSLAVASCGTTATACFEGLAFRSFPSHLGTECPLMTPTSLRAGSKFLNMLLCH